MKAIGKALFWIGFIVLMGVVMAYLILMLVGSLAFITTSAMLSICAVILVSGLLMLMGRGYERRGERKELRREVDAARTSTTSSTTDTPSV
ncbi:MAG: hypothetical protein HFJ91_10825 [Muribaculaceae bacterium]|nr:hypothetical protein [Muribaculaceae bacterium]